MIRVWKAVASPTASPRHISAWWWLLTIFYFEFCLRYILWGHHLRSRVRGGAAGVFTLLPRWSSKKQKGTIMPMQSIWWLSKTGTRKQMLTSLPLSQTLGHKKSTQAAFTNRMGDGRQTRKINDFDVFSKSWTDLCKSDKYDNKETTVESGAHFLHRASSC